MSKFENIKDGDRVRVTVEGIARRTSYPSNVELRVGKSVGSDLVADLWDEGDHIVSVQPEYEQFQPGDIVRYIHSDRDDVFVLGNEGFLVTASGKFCLYGGQNTYRKLEEFTSRDFVQVFIP